MRATAGGTRGLDCAMRPMSRRLGTMLGLGRPRDQNHRWRAQSNGTEFRLAFCERGSMGWDACLVGVERNGVGMHDTGAAAMVGDDTLELALPLGEP